MMRDEELQQPLISGEKQRDESNNAPPSQCSRSRVRLLIGTLIVAAMVACGCHQKCHLSSLGLRVHKKHHKHHHGHVNYQATLKKNREIEYAREFTAPCDYGILVFNVGPAADYNPWQYDVYQDSYVFSNNQKMCWVYPSYRGIQKGPFPWWVNGDPTNFDVAVGLSASKISHRIVRPRHSKNITASKGGDYLIIAHHKFYTPAFYENLKNSIHQWRDDDSEEVGFGTLLEGVTFNATTVALDEWEGGLLEVAPGV